MRSEVLKDLLGITFIGNQFRQQWFMPDPVLMKIDQRSCTQQEYRNHQWKEDQFMIDRLMRHPGNEFNYANISIISFGEKSTPEKLLSENQPIAHCPEIWNIHTTGQPNPNHR